MESVVLVIHLILALAIIALVLLQRSEGGGLGIGGGGGGLGGFASARGTANALTKMTALCAAGFFCTSLLLAILAGGHSRSDVGILENTEVLEIQAPVADDGLTPSAPSGAIRSIEGAEGEVPSDEGLVDPSETLETSEPEAPKPVE